MVIDDFHVVRVAVLEPEAQAPLVVDAYASASLPVAFEFLQPVLRWDTQVVELRGTVQHLQLAFGDDPEVHKAPDRRACEEGLGVRAFERLDHTPII